MQTTTVQLKQQYGTRVGAGATRNRDSHQKLRPEEAPPHDYPEWYKRARTAFEEAYVGYLHRTFDFCVLRQPALDATLIGRRVRPTLYFALWHNHHRSYPSGLNTLPAIAIELFHSASIVVDDIVDGELRRRNKAPIYRRHGTEIAILLSHELVASAYRCLQEHPLSSRLLSAATDCYRRAIAGEVYDLGNFPEMSVHRQHKRALAKTSAVFAFIGDALGIVLPEDRTALSKALSLVGEAFQLSNDTTDTFYFRESQRHAARSTYALRPSRVLERLLEARVVGKEEVGARLPYSRHCEIAANARVVIGEPRVYLQSQMNRVLQRAARLDITPATLHVIRDFLNSAAHPSFWLHDHE